MRGTVLLFLVSLLMAPVRATHIIGGVLSYEHMGGISYAFTLRLYRDCGPTNTNNTGFDPNAQLGVFTASGTFLFAATIPFPGSSLVPVVLNNPCLTAPPNICVEEAAYTTVIDLPPLAGGYVVSYQRCCRTPAILNLVGPNTLGLTCVVQVPDVTLHGQNSSPVFNAYPPIALCVGQDMVFDHSATDPDGDLLVYELCTPYHGGTPVNPMPQPPDPPPYTMVPWGPGYSQAYQMDAAPPLTIDPVTGVLTATPSQVGSYTVGVCVKEYRNGVLLSEVRRDLLLYAVPCQVAVLSSMQQQQVFCDGYTVNMVNNSLGGNFYHWDFGVPGLTNDTSDLYQPSYTYPDSGTYSVMLVVNPGWPCSDTSYSTFMMYPPLQPSFQLPDVVCQGSAPIPLQAAGNFQSSAQVTWDMGTASTPSVVQGHAISLDPLVAGTHVITMQVAAHGCSDSYTDTLRVFPPPVAYFTTDTSGCMPMPVWFDDQSTAWTPLTYLWDFGDGNTSADPWPVHTYLEPGQYTVSLTVMTDSGCVDTVSFTRPAAVTGWPQPVAGAYASSYTMDILDPQVTVYDASQGAVQWTYFVEDTIYDVPEFTHAFGDGGFFTITQVVTSGPGCTDTTRFTVNVTGHVFLAPNAFTPNGDGINESWRPVVLGARQYELSVFDRWGKELFRTQDPRQGWDASSMPQGVYIYRAWVAEHAPTRKEYVGTITLLR